MNINGRPREESFEEYHENGKMYIKYKCRTITGLHFYCVGNSVTHCRAMRDAWIQKIKKESKSIENLTILDEKTKNLTFF